MNNFWHNVVCRLLARTVFAVFFVLLLGTVFNRVLYQYAVNSDLVKKYGYWIYEYAYADVCGGGGSSYYQLGQSDVIVNKGNQTTHSPAISLSFVLNQGETVKSYAVSLDPSYPPSNSPDFIQVSPPPNGASNFTVTYQLPEKYGSYTLYIAYYATNGSLYLINPKTVTYAPSPSGDNTATKEKNPYVFTRHLKLLDTGPDVQELQKFLNTHGFPLATKGPGSLGNETEKFGSLTKLALIAFQNTHKQDVLSPAGFKNGTGMFWDHTLNFVNGILSGEQY